MQDLTKLETNTLEVLERSCPRCGKKSANASNPSGRCRKHLNKLAADKQKPGSWQRAQTLADGSLRRQNGKNGTASHKSKGRGSRKEIIGKMKAAEKKTGQRLSPDRIDNKRGYGKGKSGGSNLRAVPVALNRGRHHVDGKKLRAWQKRLKKSDTDYDEFYTYLLAKANENNDTALLSLLEDMHVNDVANFINNEDIETTPQLEIEAFAKSYVEKYQPLEKSTEVSLFQRFEDKYILPASIKEDLEKTLAKHLSPDYPDKKTKFTLMKSTYFDSADREMVRHHLSKADSRFKIRTREYAPDGKLSKSDFTYLEIKAKHGNISDKFRIKVPNTHMTAFAEGKPLVTDIKLAKANPHIGVADLVKRVDDLNHAMSTFMLRPSCEISYARNAYADGAADGLRITFDENVQYNVLNDDQSGSLSKNDPEIENMVAGYDPKNHIILEVKHHGVKPDWLTQFLNKNNIAQTSFSKYIYSMGSHAKDKK